MDLDVDVIQENGVLHSYLRDIGFTEEVETEKRVGQPVTFERKKQQGETIDADILEQVLALRATNLLFEDDLDHVDTIFANFDLSKRESIRYMFKGKSSVLAIILGLYLYFYIGGYAFIMLSIFYAYRTSDYLWKKHAKLKQLKTLMTVIQSNYSLLTRVIKFLYENEQLIKFRFKSGKGNSAVNTLKNLKVDFNELLNELNNIFANETKHLLKQIPLCEHMENPECYICQRLDSFRDDESISQLHNLYMLLQSQFLTRLIFSVVPNLVASEGVSTAVVGKTVVKITSQLQQMHTKLNKKFKFVLLNGIFVDKSSAAKSLPPKQRPKTSNELFSKSIHDLSNSLQFSLIKSRELEDSIEKGETVDFECELDAIKNELVSCQGFITDLVIIHKKYSNSNQNPSNKADFSNPDDVQLPSEYSSIIDIGYSDLDPVVPDDIFELTMNDSLRDVERSETDCGDEVDPLSKRQQKQMLKELKGRLKEQAEDWARREAMVLARKGMAPLEETLIDSGESSEEDEHIEEIFDVASTGLRQRFGNKYNYIYETENADKENYGQSEYHPFRGNNCFAEAIRQAHVNAATVTEEFTFGNSDGSSEDET